MAKTKVTKKEEQQTADAEKKTEENQTKEQDTKKKKGRPSKVSVEVLVCILQRSAGSILYLQSVRLN